MSYFYDSGRSSLSVSGPNHRLGTLEEEILNFVIRNAEQLPEDVLRTILIDRARRKGSNLWENILEGEVPVMAFDGVDDFISRSNLSHPVRRGFKFDTNLLLPERDKSIQNAECIFSLSTEEGDELIGCYVSGESESETRYIDVVWVDDSEERQKIRGPEIERGEWSSISVKYTNFKLSISVEDESKTRVVEEPAGEMISELNIGASSGHHRYLSGKVGRSKLSGPFHREVVIPFSQQSESNSKVGVIGESREKRRSILEVVESATIKSDLTNPLVRR